MVTAMSTTTTDVVSTAYIALKFTSLVPSLAHPSCSISLADNKKRNHKKTRGYHTVHGYHKKEYVHRDL
jgi:hypothetical protein